jgi:hypothetical protein
MPLPSSLATEWKQMLAAPRIPPEVQMQIEQGKALIAKQQTEITKLKGDQSAKMQALQADWQKSMAELQMEQQNTEREMALKRAVAGIDAQLKAEQAAADIILQREKFLADYQLRIAERQADAALQTLDPVVIRTDIEDLRGGADSLRQEIEAMRKAASDELQAMAAQLTAKPKRTRRKVSVERDKSGRIVGALVDEDMMD